MDLAPEGRQRKVFLSLNLNLNLNTISNALHKRRFGVDPGPSKIHLAMKSRILIFLTYCLFSLPLHSQGLGPLELGQLLEEMRAEIMAPLDGDYRRLKVRKNRVQNYQWALGSAREDLEIRYLAIPDDGSELLDYPHIEASRLAMQICSNVQESAITARDLTEEERIDLFNADWGRMYMFPPKEEFGLYLHCKMVALFREGSGMMVIFHLFDEPSPEIDNRLYTFRFMD
jgi:hypothetical protein